MQNCPVELQLVRKTKITRFAEDKIFQ